MLPARLLRSIPPVPPPSSSGSCCRRVSFTYMEKFRIVYRPGPPTWPQPQSLRWRRWGERGSDQSVGRRVELPILVERHCFTCWSKPSQPKWSAMITAVGSASARCRGLCRAIRYSVDHRLGRVADVGCWATTAAKDGRTRHHTTRLSPLQGDGPLRGPGAVVYCPDTRISALDSRAIGLMTGRRCACKLELLRPRVDRKRRSPAARARSSFDGNFRITAMLLPRPFDETILAKIQL